MINHREVLDVWFGRDPDISVTIGNKSALWWGKNADTDAELRRRFEEPLQALLALPEAPVMPTPEECLAHIILADQIPRSIYRDTPGAFSGDELALSLTLAGLERGQDRALSLEKRVFFYMPLEHAESMEHQERSVALFERLLEEAGPELEKPFASFLDFARRHLEIIARFGRFPHRNAILGRESTVEEEMFLKEPGSGF